MEQRLESEQEEPNDGQSKERDSPPELPEGKHLYLDGSPCDLFWTSDFYNCKRIQLHCNWLQQQWETNTVVIRRLLSVAPKDDELHGGVCSWLGHVMMPPATVLPQVFYGCKEKS